jgi:hypothetical protein
MVLELLELVFVDMVGEGALCATEMATEHQKLILASLMK